MTDIQAPELGRKAREGRLRELNSRLQKLVATAAQTERDDPALLDALVTAKERGVVLTIAARVAARLEAEDAYVDALPFDVDGGA